MLKSKGFTSQFKVQVVAEKVRDLALKLLNPKIGRSWNEYFREFCSLLDSNINARCMAWAKANFPYAGTDEKPNDTIPLTDRAAKFQKAETRNNDNSDDEGELSKT
mmetsp:Transcript_33952/g.44800  ORF Transcript_33952/g.44800 Transcript_33952/m.44800 type:complete len:106 (+) Transcript_33952:774-1091(+)|eukprot:CAMPEP_0117758578 /NCGR_PEP_ID=MMETSP0947-20121206/15465_1 /TAXON_ID=44440 /ORGANISM="Chattonella subsalsa, Strain CCMP2191" /LENGTH=105 /DNA_ID=CAMNT_0005578799 /DNA_START=700 /DNA_END=1017 /DNA_ORIENTATION=-